MDEFNNTAPSSIPYKQLKRTNSGYDAFELQINDALYHGGKKFDAVKNSLLRYRDLEKANLPISAKLRQSRLDTAKYEPIIAGIFDYLSSAALQEPIQVQVVEGNDEQKEYYKSINDKLQATMQRLLIAGNLHKRAYLAVQFPESPYQFQDLGTQKQFKALDARIICVEGTTVDDWELDEIGNPVMVRLHSKYEHRTSVYAPPDAVIYCWSYITKTECNEYEMIVELDEEGQEKEIADDAVATLVKSSPHTLGVVPLIPLDLPVYIIDRLRPIAESLFNRSASVEYSLDASAYQQGVIKTNKDMASLIMAESALIKLSPDDGQGGTEDLKYVGPDTTHLGVLMSDCERLDANLFKAIQAGALRTTTTDQNTSRLSGVARLREHGSIAVLLQSYGYALRQTLEKAIALIKKARGEESLEVVITGADKFDLFDLDSDINSIEKILALPVHIPDEAKQYIAQKLIDSFIQTAPPDVRDEIRKGFENPPEVSQLNPAPDVQEADKEGDKDESKKKEKPSKDGNKE